MLLKKAEEALKLMRVLSFERRPGSLTTKPKEIYNGDRCVKYLYCEYYDICLDIAAKWKNFTCLCCPIFREAEPKDIFSFIIGNYDFNFNIPGGSVYDLLKTKRIS